MLCTWAAPLADFRRTFLALPGRLYGPGGCCLSPGVADGWVLSLATWPWSPRPARRLRSPSRPGRSGPSSPAGTGPPSRCSSITRHPRPGRRGDPQPGPHRRRRQPALAGRVGGRTGQSPSRRAERWMAVHGTGSPASPRAGPARASIRQAELVPVRPPVTRGTWVLPVAARSGRRQRSRGCLRGSRRCTGWRPRRCR